MWELKGIGMIWWMIGCFLIYDMIPDSFTTDTPPAPAWASYLSPWFYLMVLLTSGQETGECEWASKWALWNLIECHAGIFDGKHTGETRFYHVLTFDTPYDFFSIITKHNNWTASGLESGLLTHRIQTTSWQLTVDTSQIFSINRFRTPKDELTSRIFSITLTFSYDPSISIGACSFASARCQGRCHEGQGK
jgi:hypothetical protein